MTPSDLAAILDRLGLRNRSEAARLLGYDRQTMHRYLRGTLTVPKPLARTLRMMGRLGLSAEQARELLAA